MFASKDALFAKSSGSYQISRSLRFRSSASAYLTRTPASAGNRKTWTLSAWVKRGKLSTTQYLLGTPLSGATGFRFSSSDVLYFTGVSATQFEFTTTAVYRDCSAWYHILLAFDTTQATSTNRVKLYVNGTQVTSFSIATYPTQNLDGAVNDAALHQLCMVNNDSGTAFDGYLAEVNFIDGQALTPSSFGAFDTNGVWQPAKYTGSYGTNGFYLNFSDNSGATATTIGKDSSGNSNNWTPNNISVTSGTTYDSMIDSPTNYADGGNGRGNYCVLNPLTWVPTSTVSNRYTPTDGNLTVSASVESYALGTVGQITGKWYFEVYVGAVGSYAQIGITNSSFSVQRLYVYTGQYNNGSLSTYGASYTTGDLIGVAYDLDNQTLTFYKNGVSQGQKTSIGITENVYPALYNAAPSTGTFNINFGQRPFTYTPPSGFSALNTQNLPTPTIAAGNKYFAVNTRTGTGSAFSVTGLAFQPDLVWAKSRANTYSHLLFDSVRGGSNYLSSDLTSAETSSAQAITAFNADGFSGGTLAGSFNSSGDSEVQWLWKAGGTGVSNTSGTITSTVSANTSAGFSVVKYTGNATANATVGHGLGVAPSMIIVKDLSNAYNWTVYYSLLAAGYVFVLNSSGASVSSPDQFTTTAPTSSVFYLGWPGSANNTNATTSHVAYCFAPVSGYSSFGTYNGNGSSDGPFVYTGFKPRWVMLKGNSASGWEMYDTSRDTYNEGNKYIMAHSNGAETTTATIAIDILSNGFKLRGSGSDMNGSGVTFYYAAFAENPFKYSRAR